MPRGGDAATDSRLGHPDGGLAAPPDGIGKLKGTGNGGLGGGAAANANALAAGVRRGYATAGHNTGHDGDSSYALEHPERIKDFGYRATHEMTVASKALIRAYYGKAPAGSYMAEGGGGTIAALSSAQRYPDDYDTIAVTGMSSYLTRHTFAQMWIWMATHKDAASFLTPDSYRVLHEAVLAACDAGDGLKDGVVGDPIGCRFDPGSVQCKEGAAGVCLTAAQVEAARKIYQGPRHARTGAELYSPLYPGSELGWGQLAGGDQPLGIPVEFFKVLRPARSSLGLPHAADRFRPRRHRLRPSGDSAGQRRRSRPAAVLRPRRAAVARRRLERRRGAAEGRHQLLQPRRRHGGRAADAAVDALLHGAGHGPRTGHRGCRELRFRRALAHRAVAGAGASRPTS